MILPKFEYKRASSLAEAIGYFNRFKGQALYLAGGTDLLPLLKQRLFQPAAVIDLKPIGELNALSRDKRWLTVGANVALFRLKQEDMVQEYFPALAASLEATSCETLQMRGTLGGNLLQDARCLQFNKSLEWRRARGFCWKMGGPACNVVPKAKNCFANYSSDNAPALLSLSAQARLVGPGGERTVKLEKLYSADGRKPLALRPGEILTQIRIPLEKTGGTYEKLRVRDSLDYPLVGVAVSLKGEVTRVCVGGVGPAPRLYQLQKLDDVSVQEAAARAAAEAKPVLNTVLPPAYRKKMVGVLFKRAIKKAQRGGRR
jgi:4-hydroxybenzoyl-CoA reductase subunit beta